MEYLWSWFGHVVSKHIAHNVSKSNWAMTLCCLLSWNWQKDQICFINSAESFDCHWLVFHCIELNRYGIILNRYDFKIFDVEFVARFK